MEGYAGNFIPVIPVEEKDHTPETPFCWNSACSCHEDEARIAQVASYVADGLMTPEEATGFVAGKGI